MIAYNVDRNKQYSTLLPYLWVMGDVSGELGEAGDSDDSI